MSAPSLREESGYDDLIWRLLDVAANWAPGREEALELDAEGAFRARAAAELDRLRLGLTREETTQVLDEACDDLFRYGPISPLMCDPEVTDIVVNGPDAVFVDRGEGVQASGLRFRSAEHLHAFAMKHLLRGGRTLNRAAPMADVELADGSRLHVLGPPVSPGGLHLSIRRFRANLTLEAIVARGTLSEADGERLRAAVQARKNIVIAGGPGAGKTTLMGALLAEVAHDQRIVAIEDVPELRPQHPQFVRLLTRPASGPHVLASSARDLVREALRMRPDRLIIGEVRGPEALDMVSAMSTGMDGSMTTLHASSGAKAVERLNVLLELASGSSAAHKLARHAIDLVLFLRREDSGRRVVETMEPLA